MFKHRSHKIPALNTTSTADISFMLLIFFLVTTSMDRDLGLQRMLPPIDKPKDQLVEVSRDNVMQLTVTDDNRLYVDDSICDMRALKNRVMDFVRQDDRRTEHVLQIQASPQADYDTYFRLQNAIVAAYNALREERARQVYHRAYVNCTPAQQQALRDYYPQRVAEVYDDMSDKATKGGRQ